MFVCLFIQFGPDLDTNSADFYLYYTPKFHMNDIVFLNLKIFKNKALMQVLELCFNCFFLLIWGGVVCLSALV